MVFLSKRSNFLAAELSDSAEINQRQSPVPHNHSIATKISAYAHKVFSGAKETLGFPLRYLGSKTWSLPGLLMRLPGVLVFGRNKPESLSEQLFGTGYEYEPKPLTKEETKQFLRNACIASSIAAASDPAKPRKMEEEWLEPYGLQVLSPESMSLDLNQVSGNIEINDKRFLDRNSGLKMMIVMNRDEAIFTFGAAGSAESDFENAKKNPAWKALKKRIGKSVVASLLGASPERHKQAEELFLAVKDHPALQGKKITLVGHCMGGALASYIGIKHEIQVNGFNTLALGAGIQREIGADKLKNAASYVTHISISKDFISDSQSSTIDRIFNFMGLRTPGNFGKHFVVPADSEYNNSAYGISLAPKNQDRIHNFYVGSMMAYLGYSNRDKPVNLAQKGIIG